MTDVTEESKVTVTITIDGRPIECEPGELVIRAAERHGVYIPRFCWHHRMTEVGMCRMCIVEIDTGRGPALQPSCMIPVSEGMSVDTTSDTTKKAQDGILEFLLINHPLDCPVCDKGGECPLQDQTLSFGPGESRMVEEKRHYPKPIPISDLVMLDRERCILCDRCTRFAKEVAGDPLIHFIDRGNGTQVNTFPDDPFSSYFSGNTVQLCPVGALTSSSYRFKARPWDLEEVESTCTTCSVGCRVGVQSSRNEVVRIVGVDTDPLGVIDEGRVPSVNHGWLCDKGRFDFESLNSPDRLATPLVRSATDADALVGVGWSDALDAAAAGLRAALEEGGGSSIGVIGGGRLTNESAYAWSKLARTVLDTDNVDAQLADGLPADLVLGLPRATVEEACHATTLLWLGPDPKEELPVLFLRLRDAVQRGDVRIVELASADTSLTSLSKLSVRYRPGELPQAVRAVLAGAGEERGGADAGAVAAARSLLDDGSVVVAYGRASLAESAETISEAVQSVREVLPGATYLPLLRRGNVIGALEMGLAPGVLPGGSDLGAGHAYWSGRWGPIPDHPGLDTTAMLRAAADGHLRALVLVGADPLTDFPDSSLAARALAGAGFIVAVDTFPSASVRHADVVLPASSWAETDGTTTNLEGRVTSVSAKVTATGTSRPDWMIAASVAARLGQDLGIESVEGLRAEIATGVPGWSSVADGDLANGVVVPDGDGTGPPRTSPRSTGSSSGVPFDKYSLRLVVSHRLYDIGEGVQRSSQLATLVGETMLRVNPHDVERLGVSDHDRVQVRSGRGTMVVPVIGDDGVPEGVGVLPAKHLGTSAFDVLDIGARLTEVRIESLG